MKITKEGFAVLENDLASRWIEEGGDLVHEPTVRAEICPHIKKGDTVVDAGAFLGAHTKAYLEAVGPTGRVLAFEPNPLSFECLKHNCPQAELYNCALGDCEMETTGIDDETNHGAHRLLTAQHGPIEVIPLDGLQLLTRLDFMKLDVEGWEPFVIIGAEKLIKQHRPILYIELNQGALAKMGWTVRELVRAVQDFDYRIQFLDLKHNLDMPQIDAFFFPL